GTKRSAHCEFFAASQTACELKIRYVRARDQQDASHGRKQHAKKISVLAYRIFEQELCGNLPASVRIRIPPGKIGRDGIELRDCLLQCRSRFKAAQTRKSFVISTGQEIVIGAQIGQWQKNVAVSRKTNALRHNANNLARHAIDIQSLSDCDRQSAELLPPNSFADEGYFRRARDIIALYKI